MVAIYKKNYKTILKKNTIIFFVMMLRILDFKKILKKIRETDFQSANEIFT